MCLSVNERVEEEEDPGRSTRERLEACEADLLWSGGCFRTVSGASSNVSYIKVEHQYLEPGTSVWSWSNLTPWSEASGLFKSTWAKSIVPLKLEVSTCDSTSESYCRNHRGALEARLRLARAVGAYELRTLEERATNEK